MDPLQGWYSDPQDLSRLRWWDGAAWTSHVALGPAATVAPSPDSVGPTAASTKHLALGLTGAAAVMIALVVLVFVVFAPRRSTTSTSAAGGSSSSAIGGLADRAARAQVPLLGQEGSATHTHTLVRVVVDGQPQVIPAGIGIDPRAGVLAAVHTHENRDVVHVESPQAGDHYRLGQFLTLWGVGSDDSSLCDYFVHGPCTVRVSVVDPSPADYAIFSSFGPMPDQASTPAEGFDTRLDQGAVVQVDLTSGAR